MLDYTEKFKRSQEGNIENLGNSKSTSSSNSGTLSINNNTPQTRITKQNLDTGAYASSVNQSDNNSSINDETTSNNNGTSSSNEEYTKEIKGNSGVSATAQAMIKQYRENIVAVDRDIIKELNTLFMGLY